MKIHNRKTPFLLIVALFFISNSIATAQEIQFESNKIDYGTLEQGADGVRVFKFTNVGTAPLIIQDAKRSCGCTVPTWPKEPILPGASSEIKVKYDTNRIGVFSKTVTLTTNDINNTTTRLSIAGTIVAKSATPAKEKTVFK